VYAKKETTMPNKNSKKEDKQKRKERQDLTIPGKCSTALKADGSCVLVKSDLFRKKWQEEKAKRWGNKKKGKEMTSADSRRRMEKTITTANQANELTDVKMQIKKVKNLLNKLMVQQALLTPSLRKTPDAASEEEEESSEEDSNNQQDSQTL